MFRGVVFGLLIALASSQSAFAQNQSVQDAINVIVLFCVAGGDKVEISGAATDGDGLELKAGGNGIAITRSSARGLVDGILNQMNSESANQASEARKCMQPYIERIVNSLLGMQSSTPSSLPEHSIWTHNTSTMSVIATGDRITIYYDKPRQGMIDEGVTPGTILFDGKRTGNKLSGTSYVFSHRCGHIPYADVGVVLSGERSIYLNGRHVPTQLGADCSVLAFRVDPSILDRRD